MVEDQTVSSPTRATTASPSTGLEEATAAAKIWIDLDNTPHVPFFIPIKRELERRNHRVVLTARDAYQVYELADQNRLQYERIGRHFGKNPVMKVAGLFWRSAQLVPFYLRERPHLALSHGARSQIMLGNVLRVPTVLLIDYEHSRTLPLSLARSRWLIVPDSMSAEGLHCKTDRVRKYRGIKEDVYAPDFEPDPSLLDELELRRCGLVITIRPPAGEAHYHNPESDVFLTVLMDRICATDGVKAVLLPRNRHQEQQLRTGHPRWFANGKTIVPAHTVDGLNMLWFSDLVVSGGGTMNREAAALGVPVYSIFRGRVGAVDRKLEQEGRLVMIREVAEVNTRIAFAARDKSKPPERGARHALEDIVGHIEHIIHIEHAARRR